MKFNVAKILKYLRKIFDSFTKTALLIVFTTVAYILLLYFLKYWWVLFTSTQVGQAYAEHFSYSYRITNDVLSTNFINLAIKFTVISFIISLIIGSICQFFLIIRYFYSNCELFGRIVFFGLPLAYIVAVYMRYVYDFGHMDTAFTIAVVPTLCVFSGGFRIAKEYVPELVDIIFTFSGQQRKTRSKLKEEESQRRADELVQKEDTKQRGTYWQIKLQDIWESYAAFIIVILIIIFVAGIMLTISQTPNFNKREEPVPIKVPKVEAPAPAPSPRPNVSATPHTNFTYSGYAYDNIDNIKLAIIDGNTYREGDLLSDNYVLKSINPTYIIIRNKADKSELFVPLH
jgi:hypothetical protein